MGDHEIQLSDDEKAFLAKLPADGSGSGNVSLRQALQWDVQKYMEVKQSLIRKELIRPGRGRGGSVSRMSGAQAPQDKKIPSPQVAQLPQKEKDVYPVFKTALTMWAADQGWTDHFIEHKPSQGSRNTGGLWTRPDFVVVGHKKFEYTPGVIRDVETFEIKLSDYGISAVFETASHSRFATKSYLAINRGEEQNLDDQVLVRTELECQRFGIGLLIFDNKGDPGTWDWRVEAIRKEPDPEEVEDYIHKQFTDEHKKQMRNWF